MEDGYHAGPSTSPQHLQQSPPIALSTRTSSKNFRSDAPAHKSPPTTPPPRSRRPPKVKGKGKQPLRAYASEEPLTAAARHSHGLSWSSTTRDSVVDNLLFSLDNISRQHTNEMNSPQDQDEKRNYLAELSASYSANEGAKRSRGHTHSSSAEYDRQVHDSPASKMSSRHSTAGSIIPNGQLRNAPHARSTRAGEGSSETARTKHSTHKHHRHGDSGSNDYGFGAVLESNPPAWNGLRSISMDHMQSDPALDTNSVLERGRPVPSIHSKYESPWETDAAPEPIVAAGPRKMQNPNAIGPVYVNPAPPKVKASTLRKTTTHNDLRASAIPSPNQHIPKDIRDQAADFVRTSSMRGVPPVPNAPEHDAGVFGFGGSARRKEVPPPLPAEKPGFFKRVFGGASRAVSNNERPTSTHPSADTDRDAPMRARSHTSATSHGKSEARQTTPASSSHPMPTLTKKTSSFFRRRKKSVSENQPPPPPMPVSPNPVLPKTAEPSPSISSLRKVMDPYLSKDNDPSNRPISKRTDSERPDTGDTNSDSLDIFHSGYTPPADASLNGRQPVSRDLPMRTGAPQNGSPNARLKVKKRTPENIVTPGLSSRPNGAQAHSTTLKASPQGEPKVSPLLDSVGDPTATDSGRRPSTGDGIIASETDGPLALQRKPHDAGGRTVEDPLGDEAWLVRKISEVERSNSPRSARLILQPTLSEEERAAGKSSAALSPKENAASRGLQIPSEPPKTSGEQAIRHSRGVGSSDRPLTSANILSLPSFQVDGNELARHSTERSDDPPLSSPLTDEGAEFRERARKIYDGNEEDVLKADAAAWMGERNTLSTKTLNAYMRLFDFAGLNILAALRSLCSKLVLRGETQQFDRIITALSSRWCECNPNHGFKAQDVVHTITYSLILLNTDLHLADIGEKMSRSAYVKNTLPTVKRVVGDAAPNAFDDNTLRPGGSQQQLRPSLPWSDSLPAVPTSPTMQHQPPTPNEQIAFDDSRLGSMSTSAKRLSYRPGMLRNDSDGAETPSGSASNALVSSPWYGSLKAWENEVEAVLKSFWTSIRSEPLPLHGAPVADHPLPERNNSSLLNVSSLKRTGSVVSKAPSENTSYRSKGDFRSMTMRWQGRGNRSRAKVYPSSTLGSSRTSFDDGNSIWSPAQSSKYSFSKTLTSASMGSLGYHHTPTDAYKHSIGFANALSQAIIREETTGGDNESFTIPGGLLEDEALALEGAPWAKEGLVKHKHHLETPDRKAKERSWVDCFAVMSKGKLTLFAFNTSGKTQSMGRKNHFTKTGKAASVTGARVGGGDWMENAEQLEVFVLRQTIASTLPPPGYSKTRPYVWALSLPSGAVHLFQVGTPEIAGEFMSTANYWSARLSKEPLSGGVSNIEYGWSENVINPALLERTESFHTPSSSMHSRQFSGIHSISNERGPQPRPSIQSSLRSSIDQGFGGPRPRLPGDKVMLQDWQPPTQSMMASQLMEVDQLKQLTAYVTNSERELERHNELKHAIELAFSTRSVNFAKAMTNWQRKSDYLLREIVKFRTYIDSLTAAQKAKDGFYAKKAEGRLSPVAKDEGEEATATLGAALAPPPPGIGSSTMGDVTPRGIHTAG